MFRISNGVRSTQTQDGSILLDIHHGQMLCLNLVGSKILELFAGGYDETRIAEEISNSYAWPGRSPAAMCASSLMLSHRHHILQPHATERKYLAACTNEAIMDATNNTDNIPTACSSQGDSVPRFLS